MSGSQPRAGGPSRRRTFAPTEKLQHLAAYEEACRESQGGAYLRREGLYSSQVTEWRKLRDGLATSRWPQLTLARRGWAPRSLTKPLSGSEAES
jgi:hypothetical protein